MNKSESIQENETYKILWEFEIETDHPIPTSESNQVFDKKTRICLFVDFAVLAGHKEKIREIKKIVKYLDFARELKKLWNMKVRVISSEVGTQETVPKNLDKRLKGTEDQRKNREHLDYSTLKISLNTWKNPRAQRRLAVTQTSVKNYQLNSQIIIISKFDHTNKCYMHNPESVQENEMHKFLWDFEIQTDHLISARQPDLVIVNKKKRTGRIDDLVVPADHRVKMKESKERDKFLDLGRELKNYGT